MFKAIKSLFTKSIYGLYSSTDRLSASSSWSKGRSLSLYEKSLYANKAIQKRAEKVGQIKFVLKDLKGNDIENEWTTLLDKPNSHMTGDQFWRTAQKYYDIVGFACIVMDFGENQVFRKDKVPNNLYILRSDLVEVVYTADRSAIKEFNYTPDNGTPITYQAEDVIYLYNPDPRNHLIGESLLSSAVRAIDTEVQISEYHANILRNGGKLETIFKIKNPLATDQVDKLKEQYRDKYAEAKKAGEPLFLGGDIDIEKTAMSPSELAYLDTKISTLDDIAIATGVPKSILGVTSGETFSNADASIRIFLRETIKPLLDNLVNVLDWRLIPEKYSLSYIDPTPEDQDQKMQLLKTASDVNALTINEKRQMLGFDPIKGGDEVLVPFNLTSMNTPKDAPTKQKKSNAKFVHPLSDLETRDMYRKIVDVRLTRKQRKMLQATESFFKGQQSRVIQSLGGEKSLFGEVFNSALEISIAKDTLLPVIRDIFKESGQDTMDTFELGKFSYTDVMETSIQLRADMFSESIIATTTDQLQRIFADNADKTRQELVKDIKDLYTNISDGRAQVIARTEVHNAVQDANLFAYKQAGLPIKIWVTVGDARVREEHQALDGEEKPIDMPFSNGLQYPSEPNCRCSI